MRAGKTWLLALLLFAATLCGMCGADAVQRQCGTISLRYRDPLPKQTVETLLAGQQGWTFWKQEQTEFAAGAVHTRAEALLYAGTASYVYNAVCRYGAMPGIGDTAGCAISAALSQTLFGSEDTVGLTLTAGGTVFTVRGVFGSQTPLALLPRTDAGFTAAELPAEEQARQNPDSWLRVRLQQSGMPEPDRVLFLFELSWLCRFASWLPLLLADILLLRRALRQLRRLPPLTADLLVFGAALLAVLALPWFFSVWPQWLIPSRWSDFSWWKQTADSLAEHLRAWLGTDVSERDLWLRQRLLGQMGLAILQGILWEALRCRFACAAGRRYPKP